jgi:hypothetical protein
VPNTKPTKKVSRAKPSATQPVSRLEQAVSEWMHTWLRQTAEQRPHRPMKDRLEALVWSWPIRLDFSTRRPNALWTPRVDYKETAQRKEAIQTHLDRLRETWYADMVYPETDYFDNWAPHDWPYELPDADFTHIVDQLRTLPGLMVPDPHDDRRWLLALLEHRWGDGYLDERRAFQDTVMKAVTSSMRPQVCEIGEEARDKAYIEVRTNRSLYALDDTKEQAQALRDWLQDAKTHKSFVEEHLSERVSTDLHRAVERTTKALDFYMNNADKWRSRRATAGREKRPWVDHARQALKKLKLSELHRRDLLIAWSLMPYPRPPRPR